MLEQLFDAIKKHNLIKATQILEENSTLIDSTNVDDWGPIHACAAYGTPEIMELIIQYGADVNQRTAYFYTPLHLAIEHGNFKCIMTLLQNSADSTLTSRDGTDSLGYLCQSYPELNLEVLISQDQTAHLSIQDNHLKIIGDIIDYPIEIPEVF